jgi:hypothetical protein
LQIQTVYNQKFVVFDDRINSVDISSLIHIVITVQLRETFNYYLTPIQALLSFTETIFSRLQRQNKNYLLVRMALLDRPLVGHMGDGPRESKKLGQEYNGRHPQEFFYKKRLKN